MFQRQLLFLDLDHGAHAARRWLRGRVTWCALWAARSCQQVRKHQDLKGTIGRNCHNGDLWNDWIRRLQCWLRRNGGLRICPGSEGLQPLARNFGVECLSWLRLRTFACICGFALICSVNYEDDDVNSNLISFCTSVLSACAWQRYL